MAKQNINVGTTANDKQGDSLRAAFQKVNANFTELYTAIGLTDTTLNLGAFTFTGSVLDTDDSTNITINKPITINGEITVDGDITPVTNFGASLGTPSKQFKSLYVSTSTIYINNVPLSIDASNNLIVNGSRVGGNEFYELTATGAINANGNLYVNSGFLEIQSNDTNGVVALSVTNNADTWGEAGQLIFEGNNSDGYGIIPSNDNQYSLGNPSYGWSTIYTHAVDFADGTTQSTAYTGIGNFKINGGTLGTKDNPDTGGWGGYDINIDPGNGSEAGIFIPGLTGQAAGTLLQIYNIGDATSPLQLWGRGNVQVVTGQGVTEKVFTFEGDSLFFPDGSLALTDSVLANGLDADIKGSVFADDSTIMVDGVNGVLRANVNVSNTWTVTTGNKTWSFIYGDVGEGTIPTLEFPGILRSTQNQTGLYADTDDQSSTWGIAIDAANAPYNVDIGEVGGTNSWRFDGNGSIIFPDSTTQSTAWTGVADIARNIESEDDVSIKVNLTDSTQRVWRFGEDGDLTFPDATVQTTAFTGNAATVDITNTNGIDTNYSITFVENRDATQYLRGDVDLTFNSATNLLTAGNIATGILKIEDGVHEKLQTKTSATGTVTHDCSSGHIFYHTSPSANWTINLTNLNLANGYATAVTIVIEQGGTGYYPSALQIAGNAQPFVWQGNTTPTPSTNRVDVVTFSILNNGLYTVLGQLTGF